MARSKAETDRLRKKHKQLASQSDQKQLAFQSQPVTKKPAPKPAPKQVYVVSANIRGEPAQVQKPQGASSHEFKDRAAAEKFQQSLRTSGFDRVDILEQSSGTSSVGAQTAPASTPDRGTTTQPSGPQFTDPETSGVITSAKEFQDSLLQRQQQSQAFPDNPNANFSSITGAQQQVDAQGNVIGGGNFTPANANFSSITGQPLYVPPPPLVYTVSEGLNAGQQSTVTPTAQQFTSQATTQTAAPAISGGAEGFSNIINTFSSVISGNYVEAVTPNELVNKGFEAVANNPLTTALALSGLPGLGRSLLNALRNAATKRAAQKYLSNEFLPIDALKAQPLALRVAANSKNQRLSNKIVSRSGFTMGAAIAIAGAIGTYPFAKFELAEAMDKYGYARTAALQAGRPDLADATGQLQDEMLDMSAWENLLSKIPYVNVYDAAAKNIKAAVDSKSIFDQIVEDKLTQSESGESEDEYWTRIREQEAQQERELIDYYNQERRKMIEFENEARRAENEQQAAFWAKEREKQAKREREEREAAATFWLEYRKRAQELSDNSRPSNLKFGLL